MRPLPIQRFTILHTTPQELRPSRHRRQRVGLLREKTPQRRVMPAQRVSAAVPVCADPRPQPLRLDDQLLTRHHVQILVHDCLLSHRCDAALWTLSTFPACQDTLRGGLNGATANQRPYVITTTRLLTVMAG